MAKTSKKNKVKVESEGQAHIQATFNNIIISITNKNGQVKKCIQVLMLTPKTTNNEQIPT